LQVNQYQGGFMLVQYHENLPQPSLPGGGLQLMLFS